MASELIAEAITDYFGERCPDFAEGCPTCEAWAEYDRWNTLPAPVATDTGLVTVAKQWKVTAKNWSGLKPEISEPFDERELVTRSQAEEILAAERAEKERAKDDLTRGLVHFVREHFPENTTFKPVDDLIGLITQFDNASTIAREYVSRIRSLEADNAALIHDLNRIKDHETELVNDNAAAVKALERISKILRGDTETDTVVTATNRLNAAIDAARAVLGWKP